MKKAFIIAGIMIIVGVLICGASYMAGAGQTNEKIIYKTENIEAESIVLNAESDISVIQGDRFCITYPDNESMSFISRYENNVYIAEHSKKEKTFLGFVLDLSLDFDAHKENGIIIEIPGDFIGKISLKTNSGDIKVSDVHADEIKIETDFGNIYIGNSFGDINTYTNVGDISIDKAIGNLKAKSDHGDITAKYIESDKIDVESDLGDIDLLVSGLENEYTINGKGNGTKEIYIESNIGDVELHFSENQKK